jgi:hypothetical protein
MLLVYEGSVEMIVERVLKGAYLSPHVYKTFESLTPQVCKTFSYLDPLDILIIGSTRHSHVWTNMPTRLTCLDQHVNKTFSYWDPRIRKTFTYLDQHVNKTFTCLDQHLHRTFTCFDQHVHKIFTLFLLHVFSQRRINES